jgi:hypothetical protein
LHSPDYQEFSMSTTLLPSAGSFAYLSDDNRSSVAVRLGQWLVRRLQAVLPTAPSAEVAAQQEAEALRRMARTLFRNDPAFASDLFAAADRHDDLHSAR